MITSYHRPTTLDEALSLLSRQSPKTVPLGGGTWLSHHRGEDVEVVDLQSLGFDKIVTRGNVIEVGCSMTLQQLLEAPSCPPALASASKLQAPLNLRNSATVAGTLVTADGRSPLTTVLLALDAGVNLKLADTESMTLGEFLVLRHDMRRPYLVTAVSLPQNAIVAYDFVARTPVDSPIVSAAVAKWPSGRTRVAVGGWGSEPMLAMDGPDSQGSDAATRNALQDATDAWGSAAYRADVGATLVARCLARLA